MTYRHDDVPGLRSLATRLDVFRNEAVGLLNGDEQRAASNLIAAINRTANDLDRDSLPDRLARMADRHTQGTREGVAAGPLRWDVARLLREAEAEIRRLHKDKP